MKSLLFTFLFVWCLAVKASDDESLSYQAKGYELNAKTGHYYKFYTVAKNWAEAFATCIEDGAYLAIINSDVEAGELKALFAKYPANTISSTAKYAGLVRLGFREWGCDDAWYTVFGQTLEEAGYNQWAPAEPNHRVDNVTGEVQHCGGMYRSGKLDDLYCDKYLYAFICEKS